MKRICTTLILTVLTAITFGQTNMETGFILLENGNFDKAEVFFENVLKENPTDKTAQICYGRAVGLSGEPKKATSVFAKLLQSNPNDFEVAINYNESFLWDKKYEAAKPLYAQMVIEHPNEFPAVLGYANTLSNLKEYEQALNWVEKALDLQPENQSAKISRKFMRLGYANQFINNQLYAKGETLLKEIFVDFPEDKDALLNLANLYLITKQTDNAETVYRQYAKTPMDSITALNGISLANHIAGKDREALSFSTVAKEKVAGFIDYELTERTYERYGQALIWNGKYVKARKLVDSLVIVYPKRNWVVILRATLGLYTGEASKSIADYNHILAQDSNSFDGNLGKANALLAADRTLAAYKAAEQTLVYYPNQKDALQFTEKLDLMYSPSLSQQAGYTFDNGNNIAVFSSTTAELSYSTKFKTILTYGYRNTENTANGNKANSHTLLAGLHYQIWPNAALKTLIGLNESQFMEQAYTQPIFNTQLELQPFKLQNLTLGYQRDIQNFNAELIAREIVQNHYQLNYNVGSNFGLGWYTQLMHTEQNDGNSRELLFSSVYYSLFKKPTLKLGANFQYLGFAEQVSTIYFSPSQYKAVEIFTDFQGRLSPKTVFKLNIAVGKQQVEESPKTGVFRAETGLQHQFFKRLSGNLYGKYSKIASATATGFNFTEIGFQLSWLFKDRPMFKF